MSDKKIIYTELRASLRRSGLILSGIALLMIAAGFYNSSMLTTKNAVEQTFQSTVMDYRGMLQSERILRTEAETFEALRAQGFVGAEPRLRWVEDVRASAKHARLMSIRYELAPREAHQSVMATGNFQLFSSLMLLQLELRHEGELLNFINNLQTRKTGIFELDVCTLTRSHDERELRYQESNLKATCHIRWYSLDTPDAVALEDPS